VSNISSRISVSWFIKLRVILIISSVFLFFDWNFRSSSKCRLRKVPMFM
jgi:hypothetical protein